MSSDNGVYILNLKDQSRVIHAQAIDNLWWSFLTFDSSADGLVATRVVDYYVGALPMSKEDALKEAIELSNSVSILEYGICGFDIDKTWEELILEAKEMAVLEIQSIKNRPAEEWLRKQDWYNDEIKNLCEILKI
jgi:hypothetical protein